MVNQEDHEAVEVVVVVVVVTDTLLYSNVKTQFTNTTGSLQLIQTDYCDQTFYSKGSNTLLCLR